jgi:hypothetical protein
MSLPDPFLIGLTGVAGAGKDTAADRLCSHHGFERHAFAEPIRDMLTALLVGMGLDYAYLFERHLKERPLPHLDVTPRSLMQTLGTEWGRELFGPQFWVCCAALTLGLHDRPTSTPVHDRIVLTDVRFAEEAAWIKSFGGVIVRIDRAGAGIPGQHVSELQAQHIKATWRIANNGTVADLHQHVDDMASRLLGTAATVPQGPQAC